MTHLMYCEALVGKPTDKIRPEGSIVGVTPRIDGTHLERVSH